MEWYLEYRTVTGNLVEWHPSPEAAIESACHLLDEGFDVHAIGFGPLEDAIGKDEIAKIYDLWLKTKRPMNDRRRQPRD